MEARRPGSTAALNALNSIEEMVLDDQTLDQLFSDVGHHAMSIEVFFRDGRPPSVATRAGALIVAREALKQGTTRGIHLRYRQRDVECWDTLTPRPAGADLVRFSFWFE